MRGGRRSARRTRCTPSRRSRRAKRGVHVLVEKPLAATLADCDAMLAAAARKAACTLGVISQRRFYEPVLRMKAAIDAGKIGTPVLGVFRCTAGATRPTTAPTRGAASGTPRAAACWSTSRRTSSTCCSGSWAPVEEVSGYWANLNHPDIEVEDTAVATLRFRSGGLGVDRHERRQKPGIYTKVHVHGSNGASVGARPTAARRSSPACRISPSRR